REIVRRGPEASRRDDELRPAQRVAEDLHDRPEPVRQGGHPGHRYAPVGEIAGDVARIRVARLARGQLRADGDDLGRRDSGHEAPTLAPRKIQQWNGEET